MLRIKKKKKDRENYDDDFGVLCDGCSNVIAKYDYYDDFCVLCDGCSNELKTCPIYCGGGCKRKITKGNVSWVDDAQFCDDCVKDFTETNVDGLLLCESCVNIHGPKTCKSCKKLIFHQHPFVDGKQMLLKNMCEKCLKVNK